MSASTTELDARYGEEDATAAEWADVARRSAEAELYWVTTVRPDGRPYMTPLIAVWMDGAARFSTGAHERKARKARNLAGNPHCLLSTGRNALHEGLDLVLEGAAVRVIDREVLRRTAEAYEAKYGAEWHFGVGDGVFVHEAGEAIVFELRPTTAHGFGKDPYSHPLALRLTAASRPGAEVLEEDGNVRRGRVVI